LYPHRTIWPFLIVLLLVVPMLAAATPARAEATLLVDVESGRVLHAENAAYPWHPASVTKLMTLYTTLRAVKEGRITLDTPFRVSANALAQSPTKMGFKVDTVVTVDNAIKMMMVKSANDMAVLLAEGVSGSIDAFAGEMNANARGLGMVQSNFVNPNGLPDDRQIMSARDLAILARALIREFPEYDDYWHLHSIRFGRRVIHNYNKLLDLYPGADGMKTGFVCASGFNLVATATRNGRRLIAVVLGAPSASVRTYHAARLLEEGFNMQTGLNFLAPSLGTADQLVPVAAEPPDLSRDSCGPHRKRPAAEDEEVSFNEGNGDNPLAFVLQGLRSANLKPSELLGQQVPALPPVNVFIGTKKPEIAAGAAAQEPQIEGPDGRLAKKRKLAKKGTKENVEAVAAKERTPAAETASAKPKPKPKKTPAASADGATSPAKPTPTSKPVTAPPSIAGTK
jgi:D-alanyl-D-alanine carboxypeptidase